MLTNIKKVVLIERAIALLYFVAAIPLPEIFYDYFRAIVFIGVGFILLNKWVKLNQSHIIFLICVLIIDNPFFPFHFPVMVWITLDILIGSYLFYLSSRFKNKG
jgi:hypothetical protein